MIKEKVHFINYMATLRLCRNENKISQNQACVGWVLLALWFVTSWMEAGRFPIKDVVKQGCDTWNLIATQLTCAVSGVLLMLRANCANSTSYSNCVLFVFLIYLQLFSTFLLKHYFKDLGLNMRYKLLNKLNLLQIWYKSQEKVLVGQNEKNITLN